VQAFAAAGIVAWQLAHVACPAGTDPRALRSTKADWTLYLSEFLHHQQCHPHANQPNPNPLCEMGSSVCGLPAMMVIGWTFCATSCSASRSNSPAVTTTDVVPSPTSSSCTLLMSAQQQHGRAQQHYSEHNRHKRNRVSS
jgi:hypothetical protein